MATYIDPTGASTFMDMSKLNVGESYAEEVSPLGRGAFEALMMVAVGYGSDQRLYSWYKSGTKEKKEPHISICMFPTRLVHVLPANLWFTPPGNSVGLPKLLPPSNG